MAKKPAPWYWKARNGWYAQINGKQHFLGKHPENARKPEKSKKTGRWSSPEEIDEALRKLLDGVPDTDDTLRDTLPQGDTVQAVFRSFLKWCEEHREPLTVRDYRKFLEDFINFDVEKLGQVGLLPYARVKRAHITDWLAAKTSWGPTMKRNAITALVRAGNWAVKHRDEPRNPFKGIEKPTARTRKDFVTPEELEKLLAAVPDQAFRDILIVSYDSGARPIEIKDLEARHLQLDRQRAVIHADEAKGRKHTRTIYFPTQRSLEVVTRLAQEHPEGPLFRNRRGNPWTGMAVKCRLEDMDHVLGRRVTHYSLRHSRITEWLKSGVDSHVVAKLAGHRDSRMIDRVYGHAHEDHEYMLEQARKKAEVIVHSPERILPNRS